MILIRINIDGTMNDINIKNITLKNIEKSAISKGTTEFKKLYNWIHNNTEIQCYGWYDGEPGFENKHDLIPGGNSSFLCDEDSSEKLLFGDIFLTSMNIKTKKHINFCVTDYATIYEHFFEGFDDCESEEEEDSESEEETVEDKKFINDNKEEDIEPISSNDSDEELDEDLEEYTTSEEDDEPELYDSE